MSEKELLGMIDIQMRARGFASISNDLVESLDFSFTLFCLSSSFDSKYNSSHNNYYIYPKINSCPNCDD